MVSVNFKNWTTVKEGREGNRLKSEVKEMKTETEEKKKCRDGQKGT